MPTSDQMFETMREQQRQAMRTLLQGQRESFNITAAELQGGVVGGLASALRGQLRVPQFGAKEHPMTDKARLKDLPTITIPKDMSSYQKDRLKKAIAGRAKSYLADENKLPTRPMLPTMFISPKHTGYVSFTSHGLYSQCGITHIGAPYFYPFGEDSAAMTKNKLKLYKEFDAWLGTIPKLHENKNTAPGIILMTDRHSGTKGSFGEAGQFCSKMKWDTMPSCVNLNSDNQIQVFQKRLTSDHARTKALEIYS